MATIDTSIYGQFLRPPKSVAEYDREARAGEMDQLTLLAAQDKRAAGARALQRADQLQALMKALPAGATDQDRVSALRGGAFFEQADQLEKGILDRDKTRAAVAKDTADTDAKKYDLQRKRIEHTLQGLSQFTQPEDARQWLADSVVSGAIPMKEAQTMISHVPKDPAAFITWRDNAQMSLLDAQKQLGFRVPDANAKLSAQTTLATNAANNQRAREEGDANRAVQRYGIDQRTGVAREAGARAAAKTATGAGGKPMPTAALKMQQEELDAIGTAGSMNADLGAIDKQIADGKLKLSPVTNAIGAARNYVGVSDENSRNLASLKSTLEKLRNDSLRLNKGVQTDGDAQRAWNELLTNINDPKVVRQRLAEIQKINERGVALRRMNVDTIRRNYGQEPLDTGSRFNQPAAIGAGAGGDAEDPVAAALRAYGEN